MIKRIISLLTAVILLLALCACSGDTGEGKTIVYPINALPTYLDPQIVTGDDNRIITANCFEGLVRLDETGNVVPGVAESWTVSDDGLSYTFKLRKDAQWFVSKSAKKFLGEEYLKTFDTAVTSYDFIFAFSRALSPSTGSTYAHDLTAIKNGAAVLAGTADSSLLGLSAPDSKTLVITIERADADFLYVLTTPACMPCNKAFFEMTGGRYGVEAAYLIYNGPFYISSWITESYVTIKKNESYVGQATVKPSGVYFSVNDEAQTRLTKLGEDTYNVAPLTADLATKAAADKKLTVYGYPDSVRMLMFNCADESVSNINLRKALAQSLNVSLLLGYGDAAGGVIPDACLANTSNYRKQVSGVKLPAVDETAAKNSWSAALEELDKTEISVVILCESEYETAIRTAMQDWQALFGISADIKVEAADLPTLTDRVQKGDYQIAYYPMEAVSTLAQDTLTCFTTDAAMNYVHYSNASFDERVSEIMRAGSANKASLLLAAEQQLVDEIIVLPVELVSQHYGLSEGVSGVFFNATGKIAYFSQALLKK